MSYFVTQYRFDLGTRHAAQQAAAHRDQGRVASRAGRKRIHFLRVEYADLGHADLGLIGQALDRAEQPSLRVRLRLGDDAHGHHALGCPLRQGERDQRAAEAENRRKCQQAAEPAPAKRTPKTRSTTKMTTLSRATTAKFVTRNRKMRFISLFFGEINRNMVTRLKYGRDVPIQFQAAPPSGSPAAGGNGRPLVGQARMCW